MDVIPTVIYCWIPVQVIQPELVRTRCQSMVGEVLRDVRYLGFIINISPSLAEQIQSLPIFYQNPWAGLEGKANPSAMI